MLYLVKSPSVHYAHPSPLLNLFMVTEKARGREFQPGEGEAKTGCGIISEDVFL